VIHTSLPETLERKGIFVEKVVHGCSGVVSRISFISFDVNSWELWAGTKIGISFLFNLEKAGVSKSFDSIRGDPLRVTDLGAVAVIQGCLFFDKTYQQVSKELSKNIEECEHSLCRIARLQRRPLEDRDPRRLQTKVGRDLVLIFQGDLAYQGRKALVERLSRLFEQRLEAALTENCWS
jgi:hypothetical protein